MGQSFLRWRATLAIAFVVWSGPVFALEPVRQSAGEIDAIAEAYVHLVLAMGQHDADYVDAFYGPPEWKSAAAAAKKPLDAIGAEATQGRQALEKLTPPTDEMSVLRREYLTKQLAALEARVRIVKGERLKFDQEARALYDAAAPSWPAAHFEEVLGRVEKALERASPQDSARRDQQDAPLWQRYAEWRKRFVIPKEKLDDVFQLAIKECRARTLAHLKLPPNESFTVEYVTGKSWSGYNWYHGDYRSVIQVNTDLPVYIDRAIDLAAHEGYPGHHVYNALLEKNLVRDRGWVEFSVYALFSPQSLIAEGTANYGKEVVFTKPERMKFEQEVLFPAAGIDPALAKEYYALQALTQELSFAGNEAARRFLNGEMDADTAAAWLEKYALMEPKRAQQRVKFIEQYRSYVINYNVGEAMVRRYVETQVAARPGDNAQWQVFEELLSSPRLPSGL